ncbi:hypothetical protein [Bradyrhizobium sp. McL0616]|uniref:hypothetical protein n=1 Tax=Bradyrhizobium sp. McL0616 TaxID=3415674 RepID=UPI003CFA338B
MSKILALTGAVLAIGAASLLMVQPADAGASMSAPSKYSGNQQVVVAHQARRPHKTDFAITEYSSSSAKTTSPKR